MKFTLLETNSPGIDPEENYDIYIIDGEYCFYDGEEYIPVPSNILSPLIREKEQQDRLRELEADPSFDPEKARLEDEARKNRLKQHMEGSTTVQGLIDDIAEIQSKEKYKRKQLEREQNKNKVLPPEVNPDLSELEQSIDDFMSNFLDNGPTYDVEIHNKYSRPNPYKELDPNFRMKSRKRIKVVHDDAEDEKPLVLFYFDRSGSFNPRYHQGKTQLGKDLQEMFAKYEAENKITVQTLYYSSIVHESEQDALNDGGNDGSALVQDIKERTAGHIANVVVLGDEDNRYANGLAEVEGAVWLVFCNQYDKTLQEHIRGKALTKQFFFTNMD